MSRVILWRDIDTGTASNNSPKINRYTWAAKNPSTHNAESFRFEIILPPNKNAKNNPNGGRATTIRLFSTHYGVA